MATAAILDFRNREFLFAASIWGARRITVPNFVKIGRYVTDILRFCGLKCRVGNSVTVRVSSSMFDFEHVTNQHVIIIIITPIVSIE